MAERNASFEKEVDDELQRERMQQLWDKYSYVIMGVAAAIVLGVGGWKFLESRRQAAAEAQGQSYATAVRALSENKTDEARKALDAVGAAGGGYSALARLRLAGVDAGAGKPAEALAAYESLANDGGLDPLIADFARLQAAMLKIDTADWTEMQNRLTSLALEGNPWRHSARELLGMAAIKAGRDSDARSNFEALLADRATPAGIGERARMMMATLTEAELAAKQPAVAPAPAVPAPVQQTTPAEKSAGKKK